MKKLWQKITNWFKKIFSKKSENIASNIVFPEPPFCYPLPNGEFPIKATYAFYSPYIEEKQFEWVKECGFNVISQNLSLNDLDKNLEFAKKYGLFVSICPFGKWEMDKLRSIMKTYKDNPTVWGITMFDEPNAKEFDKIKEMQEVLMEVSPEQNALYNLYPAAGSDLLGTPDYMTYVENFVSTVNPPYISYDCYPIREENGKVCVTDGQYKTIEIVTDVARRSNRPVRCYVLSNKHWFYPKPKTEYLRYQVFSALAYGVQMISYWTYCLPDFDKTDEFTHAPIDKEGNKTDVWYMVQEVNREIHKFSNIFLGCHVNDVSHTGNIPPMCKQLKTLPEYFTELKSNGIGLIVSQITNNGKQYVVLVNKDVVNDQTVTINTTKEISRITFDNIEILKGKNNIKLNKGGYIILQKNN